MQQLFGTVLLFKLISFLYMYTCLLLFIYVFFLNHNYWFVTNQLLQFNWPKIDNGTVPMEKNFNCQGKPKFIVNGTTN